MDKSIFTEKKQVPDQKDLQKALGATYDLWNSIIAYVRDQYPAALEQWNFPAEKYGWSFRIKDKKRAIIYLLPREQYFKVAFVFGQKATEQIMRSGVSEAIKTDLQAARLYAEGRGIQIEVKNKKILKDIHELINIKISN
jgi:hypothetical protein